MSAGAIRGGEAFVEIGGDNKPLGSALNKARGMLDNFASQAARLGAVMAAGGAAILAPLYKSISAASAYEETMNKFTVIFKDQAESVKAWGEAHASSINRSRLEYMDMLGTAQALFTGMGVGGKQAADLSKQIVELTSDMGSFWDISDTEAWTRLASGIVGETEAVRRWGIDVSEAALKEEILRKGLKKSYNDMRQSEKVLLRIGIIMRSTTAQQGDALRTADQYANSLRGLWAQVENLAVIIGNHLLPTATKWINKAIDAIKTAMAWTEKNEDLVKVVAALGLALSAAGTTLLGLAAGAAIISTLLTPLSLVVAGVALVAAAILTVLDVLGIVNTGFSKFVGNIRIGSTSIGAWTKAAWIEMLIIWEKVKSVILTGWGLIQVAAGNTGQALYLTMAKAFEKIGVGFWGLVMLAAKAFDKIGNITKKMWADTKHALHLTTVDEYMKELQDIDKSGGNKVVDFAKRQADKTSDYWKGKQSETINSHAKTWKEFDAEKEARTKASADRIKDLRKREVEVFVEDMKKLDPSDLKKKITSAPAAGAAGAATAGTSAKAMQAVGSFFNLQGSQMIGGGQAVQDDQLKTQKKMAKHLEKIEENAGAPGWK